jgi:anti-sigma B factor antagonist
MTEAGFERGKRAGEALLLVSGEIDIATANAFRDQLRELIAEANSPALVDLAGVTFMDSSGLDALADARRRAAEDGVELVLVEPSSPVRMVLEVAGMWTLFQVRPGCSSG